MSFNFRLFVFLGNPGKEYEKTRHNIGWMVNNELDRRYSNQYQKKFHGEYSSTIIRNTKVMFYRPHTYMNKSGTGVRAIIDYFSIPPGNTCIIHDDLETPFGTLAFSQGGGTGGHNGLKSIKQHIGTDFFRLKIGISRPAKGSVSSYVLSRFTQDEEAGLPRIIDSAADTLEELLSGNITTAQWKKQVLS